MKLYWVKTSALIRKIFSGFIWKMPEKDKVVYLTFDDGPTPEVTPWVLEALEKHQAKATFFCIGNNIAQHPDLFEKTVNAGHAIGNHTYNHLNGWKTNTDDYLENAAMAEEMILRYCSNFRSNMLFRPPYGRIGRKQLSSLKQRGYRIIMWDVLSADFDTTITPEQCLDNVIKNVETGSIIIFHDSIKAFPNLKYALPKVLDYLTSSGYRCEAID